MELWDLEEIFKKFALGVDGFPTVTVNAVYAAHMIGNGSNVIQVCSSVNLGAGVEAGIDTFFLGHTIGMREVHIYIIRLIDLAFVGEEDLWLRPGIIEEKVFLSIVLSSKCS